MIMLLLRLGVRYQAWRNRHCTLANAHLVECSVCHHTTPAAPDSRHATCVRCTEAINRYSWRQFSLYFAAARKR